MTREEAITNLNMISIAFVEPVTKEQRKLIDDTFEMAIQALSQEPCDNAISRKPNCIDCIHKSVCFRLDMRVDSDYAEKCGDFLTELPPVTQKSGKWIPVSERLPEDEQKILFSTKTGRVHSGKYHDDDSANQWYSYRDNCRAWNNVVTAWMPLPESYKAESEEI